MGPRLLGRGNSVCRAPDPRGLSRFNGAASVGTRKSCSRHHWRLLALSLQWGRVCWDAEIRDLVVERGVELELQWGRVCWDAEIVHARWGEVGPTKASMGPRLLGRGNGAIRIVTIAQRLLQWGRVCWDAEIAGLC